MKKTTASVFLFFLLSIGVFSQNPPRYELLAELEQKADFITLDKLGNLYLCNGSLLYKYDQNGNLSYSYSAFSKGKISSFDVSNPLKIVVFSKDFTQIAFLDQKLIPLQTVNSLSEWNLYAPAAVCSSYDNGFWIYDEILNQLFRFDANGKLSNKSRILGQIWDKKGVIVGIKETEAGLLLVNDAENGLLIFDRFANYLKTLPVFSNRLFLSGEMLLYTDGNSLKTLNISNLQENTYSLPQDEALQVCIENKKLFLLTKDNRVQIYLVMP